MMDLIKRHFLFNIVYFSTRKRKLSTTINYVLSLTLEGIRGFDFFLALNFRSFMTDYQKLWYNCSLFVNTSFDPNKVTLQLMTSSQ